MSLTTVQRDVLEYVRNSDHASHPSRWVGGEEPAAEDVYLHFGWDEAGAKAAEAELNAMGADCEAECDDGGWAVYIRDSGAEWEYGTPVIGRDGYKVCVWILK